MTQSGQSLGKVVQLSSGLAMPTLAFGTGTTWFHGKHCPQKLSECLKLALDAGFRHIDEAEMYQTESDCGPAI